MVSLISYNLAALWKIINYSQIIFLFSLHNLSTTPELDGFLSSLIKDSRIPNIYDYIIDEDYDVVDMPSRFTDSYKHPLILDIFGHVLTIWILVTIALLFSYLLKNSNIS